MTKARTKPFVAPNGEWPDGAELIPITALKPYAQNARTHSRRQIKQIAKSIEHFGFLNPVLIDEGYHILAGHGRVEAGDLLGWSHVPTLRIEHLSETEKRAYILADNRLAEEAGWDNEILAIELQGLIELEFPIELTGFHTTETDIILEAHAAAKGDDDLGDDFIPEPSAPGNTVTAPGNLWILGNHYLLCGDATKPEYYKRLLGADRATMVFTDPPYNVPINGHVSGKGKNRHPEFAMASGEMSAAEFTAFLETIFSLLVEYSTDGSIHFVCMDWRHLAETLAAAGVTYTEFKNLCAWVKANGGMGTFYRSRHELVFVFKNGTAAHINNFELGQTGRYRTNVWEYAGVNSFGKGRDDALSMHPTVKPVAMVADAIKDCSKRRQIILDPFGGSGTTLIAAEKTGRRARLLELDPAYCDTIIRRWQKHTGKRAIHVESNMTFEAREEALRAPASKSAAEKRPQKNRKGSTRK